MNAAFPTFKEWLKQRASKWAVWRTEPMNYYKHAVDKARVCNRCNGTGRDYPDDAFCDPVEGYKMCDKTACPACGGCGQASEVTLKADYKAEKTKHTRMYNAWATRREMWHGIKIVLDDEEIAFLKANGLKVDDL